MDEEGKFWIAIWGIIACMIAALIIVAYGYAAYRNSVIGAMVASGTDPVAAYCAIKADTQYSGDALICAQVAGQGARHE